MNRLRPAQYLALLLLPLAALVAGTGGDDREALTLEEIFLSNVHYAKSATREEATS